MRKKPLYNEENGLYWQQRGYVLSRYPQPFWRKKNPFSEAIYSTTFLKTFILTVFS